MLASIRNTTGRIFLASPTELLGSNVIGLHAKIEITKGCTRWLHQYVATTKTAPEGASPISLEHLKNGVRMVQLGNRHRQTWQSKYLVPKTPTLTNQDFATFIGAMDAWEFELLQHVQLESDAFTICRQLKDGFVAACDGSVEYETNGSFGWIH
jgi:hypothetical protein